MSMPCVRQLTDKPTAGQLHVDSGMASLEGTSSELVETTVSSEFDSDSEESSNSEEPEVCVPSLLDRLKSYLT